MKKNRENTESRRGIIEQSTEAIAWIQIVLSPLLVGIIIGGIIFLSLANKPGLIIGIAIACIGLFVGVIVAIRLRKKSSVDIISRVNASPELDQLNNKADKPADPL